jgi:hypothetical protein
VKPKLPQPALTAITYDRVRDVLTRMAEVYKVNWYAVHAVIDVMNGWDGGWDPRNKTMAAARKKLQQALGSTHHEMPTAAQARLTRLHLDKLVEEGLVEKERGGGRSNNSWSYRWITQAMRDQRELQRNVGARGRNLARQLSIALGGDGESGVQAWITPDNTIGIKISLYEKTAHTLLDVLVGVTAPVNAEFAKRRNEDISRKEP